MATSTPSTPSSPSFLAIPGAGSTIWWRLTGSATLGSVSTIACVSSKNRPVSTVALTFLRNGLRVLTGTLALLDFEIELWQLVQIDCEYRMGVFYGSMNLVSWTIYSYTISSNRNFHTRQTQMSTAIPFYVSKVSTNEKNLIWSICLSLESFYVFSAPIHIPVVLLGNDGCMPGIRIHRRVLDILQWTDVVSGVCRSFWVWLWDRGGVRSAWRLGHLPFEARRVFSTGLYARLLTPANGGWGTTSGDGVDGETPVSASNSTGVVLSFTSHLSCWRNKHVTPCECYITTGRVMNAITLDCSAVHWALLTAVFELY